MKSPNSELYCNLYCCTASRNKRFYRRKSSKYIQTPKNVRQQQCCHLRSKTAQLASFDETLREKFSGRGLRFFELFLAIPFRYFGLFFGVTTSVKVSYNGLFCGGQYCRWRIFVIETARKLAQPTLSPKIPSQLGENDTNWEVMTFFFWRHRFTERKITKTITATAALACFF